MGDNNTGRQKGKERNVYLLVAGVGFLAGIFCVGYYVSTIKTSSQAGINGQLFYLILLLFGVAVSAVIFGVMNSFAEVTGEAMSAKYKLTGPIVGVLLVVIGGFVLPKPTAQNFSVQVLDKDMPLAGVNVKLTLVGMDIAPQQTNASGLVTFVEIPKEKFINPAQLIITRDGYRNISLDTLLTTNNIRLVLVKAKKLVLTGKVLTAADVPIPDAEIRVLGTPFFAKSMTNGDYRVELDDLFEIGDNIHLLTTHPAYEDKDISLQFSTGAISKDITLNHLRVQ